MSEDLPEKKGERGEIVFRYDRSRRLERASPEVRWLESQKGARKHGLFYYLFATRASRILFVSILGLALYFLASPLVGGGGRRSASLGGEGYSGSALYFEGRVLVVLSRRGGLAEEGRLESLLVRASLPGEEGRGASFEFPIGGAEREEFRLALAVGPAKPERILLRLSLPEGGLELLLPVD